MWFRAEILTPSEAGGSVNSRRTGLYNEFQGYRMSSCLKETKSQTEMEHLFYEVSSVLLDVGSDFLSEVTIL